VLRVQLDLAPSQIDEIEAETLFDERPRSGPALAVMAARRHFVFSYSTLQFFVDRNLRDVRCVAAPGCDPQLIRQLFLGLIAAFVVNRRGAISLHAAAVQVGNEAVALVAPAGAGKSSLAASFVGAGHQLVSDDFVAVRWDGNRLWALPGPPHLRLWPDAARRKLWGGAGTISRDSIRPNKRQVALPADRHVDRPLVLGSAYFLERVHAGPARLASISQRQALISLAGSIHANFLSNGRLLWRQFELLAEAIPTLIAHRLLVPADFAQLSEARSLIGDEAQRVSA
jgi:hypothetical protein